MGKKHYLDEPATSRLTRELQKGGFQFSEMPLTIESLVSKVANELKKKGTWMSKIIIGRYIPGNSIVYKMDPRGKIIATFLFIVIIFLANNWLSYFFLSIFTLLAVWATKLKPKVFLGWSKAINLVNSIYFSFAIVFYYRWKSLLAVGNFQH